MSGSEAVPSGAGPGTWRLAQATVPRLLGGGSLVLAGLLVGRPDVVVVGIPLVLAVLWGLAHRPPAEPAAELADPRYVAERSRVESTLTLAPVAGVGLHRVRVGAPGHRDLEALVDARTARELRLSFVTARTGRLPGFTVDLLGIDAQDVRRREPRTLGPRVLVVRPRPEPLRDLPLPSRLQGLTGAHRSSRPGDGGDLRDVALFGPGDRLRRIDWKTTARRAVSGAGSRMGTLDLYVRRTFAVSDAHVVLVLDARDAVGPDVATWPTGVVHPDDLTSLDLARRAAASIARGYIAQGDRVGLVTLGRHRLPVRPAGGRRHLAQILHRLALAEPLPVPAVHVRAPKVPSGSLVVMFSTFLDDEAARLASTWRYHGHRTIAVDVLAEPILDRLGPRARTAARIVRMERHDRLAELVSTGVEVVSWDEDASGGPRADVALAAMSRTRRVGR